MNRVKRLANCLRLSVLIILYLLVFATSAYSKNYKEIEWVSLIPKADLDILLNPPKSIMAIPDGSPQDVLGDKLASSIEDAIAVSKSVPTPEEQAYYAALKSTKINETLINQSIRIPGFIVPIEYNDDQVITEFFLVPYFGACIHTPPPPPNQIIYVKYDKGLQLDALYDPFWIEGRLLKDIVENDLATAAYKLEAENIKPYENYN